MSYLKGKNIKQRGDCLTYYFVKKIECISNIDLIGIKPMEFEKW